MNKVRCFPHDGTRFCREMATADRFMLPLRRSAVCVSKAKLLPACLGLVSEMHSFKYRKCSFSGPGAYFFKRARTPATIGDPALVRDPAGNFSN